jgi:hypothetical protein
LQLLEAGAGVKPEFLGQTVAQILIDVQRLGLAPAAVQRQHQLTAQALAQGVLRHQRAQLTDQLLVSSERKVRLDPVLDRIQPQLF